MLWWGFQQNCWPSDQTRPYQTRLKSSIVIFVNVVLVLLLVVLITFEIILQFEEKGDSRLNLIPPETSLFLSSITGSYVWEGAKKWYFTKSSKPKHFVGVEKGFYVLASRKVIRLSRKLQKKFSLKNHNSIQPVHLLIELNSETKIAESE